MIFAKRLHDMAIQNKVPFWLVCIDRRSLCMSNDYRCIARIMTKNCVEFYSREINRESDWQQIRAQLKEFAQTEECQAEWLRYLEEFPEHK